MIESLEQEVIQWAEDKGIFLKSTPYDQLDKTREEVEELFDAVFSCDCDEAVENIKGELGDVLVTLIIQANYHELTIGECLSAAYRKISKRTGKMENGVFVKDE